MLLSMEGAIEDLGLGQSERRPEPITAGYFSDTELLRLIVVFAVARLPRIVLPNEAVFRIGGGSFGMLQSSSWHGEKLKADSRGTHGGVVR